MTVPIEVPETPEVKELQSMAADWQSQFHALKSAIELLGYEVYYNDCGKPAIRKGTN